MSLTPVRSATPDSVSVVPASTTFGSLLEEVNESLSSAVAWHRQVPLRGRRGAVAAAVAHAELLGALATLWAMLWRGHGEDADVHGLGDLMRPALPARPDESEHTAYSRALVSAATAARIAADLLATHHAPGGGWRSPESELLGDPDAVQGAAGAVALLVSTAMAQRSTIARALRDDGVGVRMITRLLGEENELQLCASRCARSSPAMSQEFAGLGVARPVVRPDDEPDRQALDRWRRLRTSAWDLSSGPTVSLTTLTDLATAACVVNRAAASTGATASTPEVWRALRTRLADLRTTTLRSATVRTDIVVLGMLLQDLDPARRRRVATEAVAGLPQLARWCATAFATTRAHDIVYVDATRLTGYEVTDHPELALAKLQGRLVASPAPRLLAVRTLYRIAAGSDLRPAHCTDLL